MTHEMNQAKEKTESKRGRPVSLPEKKSDRKIEIDGDYVVIRVPKKELSRKLLEGLF